MWNFHRLNHEVTKNRRTCINWLEKRGLLPKTKHCSEGHLMKLNPKPSYVGEFRCRKIHLHKANEKVSRNIGTWLENGHCPPEKALVLTMCFAVSMSYKEAVKQSSDYITGSTTSRNTVCTWYQFCREVITEQVVTRTYSNKLGGEGSIIDINECQIGPRRHNFGRVIEGMWLIGFIDRATYEMRLDVCEDDRDLDALASLIKKNIAPGSVVMSKNWKGCNIEGNRISSNLPDTVLELAAAKFQKKEVNWFAFLRGNRNKSLCDKLTEYVWRRDLKRSCTDPFDGFISIVREVYPIK